MVITMTRNFRIDADAARNGCRVAAADIAFPGIGRLRQDGGGRVLAPANHFAGS